LFARLPAHVQIEAQPDGNSIARFDGDCVGLGTLSAPAAERAQDLREGLPLGSFVSADRIIDAELHRLVRRLAGHGLMEYRLAPARGGDDQVVIEPQMPGYWPLMPRLGDADVVVLSRFAYLRRRGDDLVLESPLAGALFRICDPKIASAVALLAAPQPISRLRRLRRDGLLGAELLALLVDCRILFKLAPARDGGLRPAEGDDDLVLWDFHDLLFHARSTQGRHANPAGGVYPYAGAIAPLPAVRPRWPGRKIDLRGLSAADASASCAAAQLLRARHSTRVFDDRRPITLAELARFLDGSARVQSKFRSRLDLDSDGGPVVAYTARPYPAGGSGYELELYLAVNRCEGLARGCYHYDADAHALVPIRARPHELEALLKEAEFAMGAPAPPQILITIAARFGRISWKYSSIAYALVLKDVGVLMQTFYLLATDMGLGACAIGSTNIELFARITGIEFHVEGPVGEFAIGRGADGEDRHRLAAPPEKRR
jgi:SagB-type dehydrogenase family enzyme